MAYITVQFDQGQLDRVRQTLKAIPRAIPVVMSRGINRTLTTTRAETVRRMRTEVKLPADTIRRRIKIYWATRAKWRGKVWIGGGTTPLSKFGARQTTRKHIVVTTAAQSMWLYYNVLRPKYGMKARFSWRYHIRRRMPIVTYDTGKGRQTLQPAYITKYKNGRKAVKMPKNLATFIDEDGDITSSSPLFVTQASEVMVMAENLIEQARSTVLSLQAFASRTLVKNIDSQIELALSKTA